MTDVNPSTAQASHSQKLPDISMSVRQTFGLDSDMMVPAFSQASDHVPDRDDSYYFDHDTTMESLPTRSIRLIWLSRLTRTHGQFSRAATCSICVDLPVP